MYKVLMVILVFWGMDDYFVTYTVCTSSSCVIFFLPDAPVVQLVTSKPSDVGTRVRISVSSHELGFFLTKKKKMLNKWRAINFS